MSNVQAALGCAQIQRIDELVCRKRAILANYISEFDSQGISYQGFNYESKNSYIGAWMPTVVLDEPSSSSRLSIQLQSGLKEYGIDARPFFSPLSSTPAFKKYALDLNNYNYFSYSLPKVSLNLPCSHDISDAEINYVTSCIKRLLSE